MDVKRPYNGIRISIVTVCLNSEAFISRAIESVLGQTFSPYEYIVVDGQSTDNTMAVIESYRQAFEDKGIIYKTVSESDNGIYDAMNKGIALTSGDIVGMINSDDWYEPDALQIVADTYSQAPFDLFYADIRMIRSDGSSFIKASKNSRTATSRYWNHPTTFIAKEIYNRYPYRNKTIHDDFELILRIRKQGVRIKVVNKVIANFTMEGISHEKSIAKTMKRIKDKYEIYSANGYSPLYFFDCLMVEIGKQVIDRNIIPLKNSDAKE